MFLSTPLLPLVDYYKSRHVVIGLLLLKKNKKSVVSNYFLLLVHLLQKGAPATVLPTVVYRVPPAYHHPHSKEGKLSLPLLSILSTSYTTARATRRGCHDFALFSRSIAPRRQREFCGCVCLRRPTAHGHNHGPPIYPRAEGSPVGGRGQP